MSGIQRILYAIWLTNKDVGSSFNLMIERILMKWEPILRGDMQNIRWLPSNGSLKYLSTTQNEGKVI